jgi:DNA-binding NarL/FixJ family response regulator
MPKLIVVGRLGGCGSTAEDQRQTPRAGAPVRGRTSTSPPRIATSHAVQNGTISDPTGARSPKEALTALEQSIIKFIADGQSNKQIARTLGVTPETIKTHVKRIFVKLSAESRAQAVVRAQSLGFLRNIPAH